MRPARIPLPVEIRTAAQFERFFGAPAPRCFTRGERVKAQLAEFELLRREGPRVCTAKEVAEIIDGFSVVPPLDAKTPLLVAAWPNGLGVSVRVVDDVIVVRPSSLDS